MSLKRALLVASVVVSGCGLLTPKGPSEVARGEYYSAGKPEYDSFFILLHEKQVELLAAPTEPFDVRQNLTQAVALTPDASDDSLGERLGQELKKLANQGLRVRLDVPEPSTTVDASATLYASETSTATPLRTTLPEAATRLVRSRNRMLATKIELEKIRVMGIELEGNVDPTFRVDGPWKRDEVRQNLADGQKVITLMASRAQDVVELDQKLLALVVTAATTDPNLGKNPAYTGAPPASEDSAKPARRAAFKPANAPPAARSAADPASRPSPAKPPSKPAPKPRGTDDEAPRPKPTQGSAPAEIEP